MNLREKTPVERPISDMRIHIDYQAQMSPPWLPYTSPDGRLTFERGFASEEARKEAVKVPQPRSTILNLNAFKVRDEFHALDTQNKHEVLAFLNATGAFWRLGSVTAEQIKEWQEFSKVVHCNNLATMPRKVLRALDGYTQEFFHASYDPGYDAAQLVSETPSDPIQRPCPRCGQPSLFNRREDMERGLNAAQRSRHGIIFELVQCFICPQNGILIYPPFRKTATQGVIIDPPHSEIEAVNVLEAVAACAWVERFDGVKYRNCKLPDCPKIFKVESEHERRYCSDSCAATFRQRQRRAKHKKAAAKGRARQKNKAAKTKSKRGAR